MQWIHQRTNWPDFYWDEQALSTPLAQLRSQQPKLAVTESGEGAEYELSGGFGG